MKRVPVFILLVLLAAVARPAADQPARQAGSPAMVAEVDRLAAAEFGSGGPGGALIVVKDGKTLVRKAYGLADVELGVPARPEMIFRVGSVTKQFTAALVMMQVEKGTMALDDVITKYLPDYPEQGGRITIEHLLTHTSGIPDYTSVQRVMADVTTDRSPAEVIDLFKTLPLDSEPGQRMRYTNSGYFLLGAILEKVTGKTYSQLLDDLIFKPLGMTHSAYIDDTRILPDRARGYQELKGALVNARRYSNSLPFAAGGVMSSVDDLARWDAALSGDRLLRRESRERMFTSAVLGSGERTGYGYGWYTYERDGMRTQEHGGVIFGYVAYVLRIPEQHLFVALLTNRQVGSAAPFLLARKAALAALGRPFADPVAATVAPDAIDALAGYYETESKAGVEFARKGECLTMKRGRGELVELSASSPTEFFQKGTFVRVRFEKDATGRIPRATISDWGEATKVARAAKTTS